MNFVRKLMVLLSAVFLIIGLSSCEELLGKMLNEELNGGETYADTPSVVVRAEIYEYSLHYGDTQTLEVNASVDDGGTLSYQWYSSDKDKKEDATAISGATSSSYTYTAPSEEIPAKYFWCKVTNKKSNKTADIWTSYAIKVTVSNIIRLKGYYDENTTWNSDYTYYLESWVNVSKSLTIPPKTVIKIGKEGSLQTVDEGIIKAIGTEDNQIIFTSYCDNSVGITIPEFKDYTKEPGKGDWGAGIYITGEDGSEFKYCVFRYSNKYALKLASETTVTYCKFTENKSDNYSGAITIDENGNESTVTNNIFYNNDWPITCSPNYSVSPTNIFHNPEDEKVINEIQAIALEGGKYIEAGETVDWKVSEIPYFLRDWFSIYGTLNIGDGVKVKVQKDSYIETNDAGIIIAKGTEANPIIFTSYRDNSVGVPMKEYINNNPDKGDWKGIQIKDSTGSKFEYCKFSYTKQSALSLNNSADVKNCTFTYNKSEGRSGALHLNDRAGDSIVTNNTFYNNDWPLYCPNKYTVATSNIFHNPDNEEIKNQKQAILLDQGERIEGTTYWAITELPYFVTNGGINVYGTLTIADNVIVRFSYQSELNAFENGQINLGTNTILTSYRDDAHGGDIEADGESTAENGDWRGIWFENADGWKNSLNMDTTRVLFNDKDNLKD